MEKSYNVEHFPNNVQAPIDIEIDDSQYKLYGFTFGGLYDFYNFLKKGPKTNTDIFGTSSSFAGRPYDEAIELLIQDNDPGYQEYLKVQRNLRAYKKPTHKYKVVKSIAGGAIDPQAYATSSPEIYRVSRLMQKPKFITIDTQIAYNCGTSKNEVFNKAVIITNLIHALERKGYNVDVNSFMMASEDNEIIQALFKIKRHGQITNYQAIYKTLVDVEFFRRLGFRIIEASEVRNSWSYGYGHPTGERLARKVLNLNPDDIYFGQPMELDIGGENIGEDFENVVSHLNLEKIIDVEKEKRILQESAKVLKKEKS